MKIDRLFEITIILLNKRSITAKELAERFNVSTRTIYRDIDILSASGVPVYTNRGTHGGISILDNYSLSKTILSKEESESILFSLKTLQITKYPEIGKILEKLSALFQTPSTDWIHIDFFPWGSNPNQYNKMDNIKNAILKCHIIEFDYINTSNKKTHYSLEPLRLIFKGQAWYLWGWEITSGHFGTFRISRIKALKILEENFDREKIRVENPKTNSTTEQELEFDKKNVIQLELKFNSRALYRLYDDYDDNFIQKNDDGTYTVKITFPEGEWAYEYILSFGDNVEVINPPHIRQVILHRIKNMEEIYSKHEKN